MSGGGHMAPSTVVSGRVREALDGMSARDLEEMQRLIEQRLRECSICRSDGAETYRVSRRGTVASILLCPACFNKHRLPEGRVKEE